MKNPLVLDNIVFSLQKAGGISVVWKNLIEGVVRSGEFDLRCIEYPHAAENIFRKTTDIPAELVERRNPVFLHMERYLPPDIKCGEPFLFHSSYYRICNSRNAINVTTVHDFIYEYFVTGLQRKIHLRQKNYAIRHADAIVCVSQSTKKDLFRFFPELDERKVHVIHNGVADDYCPTTDVLPELFDHILFVGSRGGYKNFKFLVDTISAANYKLAICGAPVSADEKEYLNERLGAARYITFNNPSNTELNRVYNSVRCLVYPSSYEGFGMPLLEAQRAGCPVIAYNISSIQEVMGSSPLLLEHLSKNELLGKLRLLEDKDLVSKVAEAGRENASHYSWRKATESYCSLYKELFKHQ